MHSRSAGRTWQRQARATFNDVFLDHPRSLGESYWQHQAHATRFGATLVAAGIGCLVHGVIPALFAHTASRTVAALHAQMRAMGRLDPAAAVAARPQASLAGFVTATDPG